MASIYDKASLVLIPSGTKTSKVYSQVPTNGDGDFTFSRSTAATRVNASGNIEKETQNLLTYGSNFEGVDWSLFLGTLTSGQSGYDGSSNAYLLTATDVLCNVQQNVSQSGVHTLSVYAKAGTQGGVFLRLDGGSNPRCFFDLTNGLVGAASGDPVDTSIEDVGGGWYRCSISVNSSTTTARIYLATAAGGFSASGNIYIQDAQLEQGLVARDYIETTTTAIYGGITDNVPRLDYTDSSCPALLLEPQRTNIVPISEGVPEDSTAVTLTKNYGTSPEGVQNSLKVQKLGVTSNDRIYPIDNYNATLVSGNEYSLSAFVKNIDVDGITTIACRLGSGGTLFRLGYEWNGSSLTKSTLYGAGTRTNEILEDYGNGWWRIGFTFEADGTQSNIEIDVDRDNGSDTTSIETWGWQLESATGDAGPATSYIPTYGSAVTRNMEPLNLFDLQDNGLVTSTTGTLFLHPSDYSQNAIHFGFENDANTSGFRIRFRNSSVLIYERVSGSNVEVASINESDTEKKLAISWNNTNLLVSVNGTTTTHTITSAASSGVQNLKRLNSSSTLIPMNQILVFPTQLTEAELNDLTTI